MHVSPVCSGGTRVTSAYWIVHRRQLPACPACANGPSCPPADVLLPHAAVAAATHTMRSAILLTSNASLPPSERACWLGAEETRSATRSSSERVSLEGHLPEGSRDPLALLRSPAQRRRRSVRAACLASGKRYRPRGSSGPPFGRGQLSPAPADLLPSGPRSPQPAGPYSPARHPGDGASPGCCAAVKTRTVSPSGAVAGGTVCSDSRRRSDGSPSRPSNWIVQPSRDLTLLVNAAVVAAAPSATHTVGSPSWRGRGRGSGPGRRRSCATRQSDRWLVGRLARTGFASSTWLVGFP